MKRIIALPKITDECQKVFEKCPVNVTRTMLTGGTEITNRFLDYGLTFGDGTLSDNIREGIILRVAYKVNCPYEVLHHLPLAIKAGISEHDLEALKKAMPSDERLSAAVHYADIILSKGVSDAESFSRLTKYFSQKEIVYITLLIGHYLMSAIFINNCGVEMDRAPVEDLYK